MAMRQTETQTVAADVMIYHNQVLLNVSPSINFKNDQFFNHIYVIMSPYATSAGKAIH